MRNAAICFLTVLLICLYDGDLSGYSLGPRWLSPSADFCVTVPSPYGQWTGSFERAMSEWTSRTAFRFNVGYTSFDPCSNPNYSPLGNGVKFASDMCGSAWGTGVLAATRSWYRGNILAQSGIIFNATLQWSEFDGPWSNYPGDFHRVAVHELGHVIGLGHENSAVSIMNPYVGSLTTPQVDDIAGVNALYPPSDSTPPTLTVTGASEGQKVITARITLTGTATDSGRGDSGISSVTVNGNPATGGTATGSATAYWSYAVSLNPGANLLTIVATDGSSQKNKFQQTMTVYLTSTEDTLPPNLTITYPREGQTVATSTITLTGTATDGGKGDNGIYSVTVNGFRANSDTAAGSGIAHWSRTISLASGSNTLTVAATDNSSSRNVTIQSMNVILVQVSPDTVPPTLVIASPAAGQAVCGNPWTISGSATDAGHGDNGISSVTVNGIRAAGDTASGPGTADWHAEVNLNAGLNSIEVVAMDASPNLNISRKTITVEEAPCQGVDTMAFTLRGAFSATTAGSAQSVGTGYARALPDWAGTVAAGVAIFGFRQNGTLVTEAGVPASALVQAGRIYAEVNGTVSTGLAIANPNREAATLSFFFTDAKGMNFGANSTTIEANSKLSVFLDQSPFKGGSLINGTFTFYSSLPIAAASLRSIRNERGESLFTTLPVAQLGAPAGETVVFPHFADGGGWSTQIVLVNPTDEILAGSIQFFSQGDASLSGQPVYISLDGHAGYSFQYSIPPRSSQRLQTAGTGSQAMVGSVRVIPNNWTLTPAGTAIFRYRTGGITVTETGVPAVPPGSAFRLYSEASGTFGAQNSLQSGVAIANLSYSPAVVQLELSDLTGATVAAATLMVPAQGQVSRFLNEIPGLSVGKLPFQGVLRVSANTPSISVLGLRGRINERREFMITAIPAVNESTIALNSEWIFPHLADGGGYTTQFVLLGGANARMATGVLRFLSGAGQPLRLPFK
jgi:hypothetical protein